jgi:co-chaperonin GroES (HSP10)
VNKVIAVGMTCDMNDKVNNTVYCHDKINYKKLAGQKFVYTPKECFTERADIEGYCRGNLKS